MRGQKHSPLPPQKKAEEDKQEKTMRREVEKRQWGYEEKRRGRSNTNKATDVYCDNKGDR